MRLIDISVAISTDLPRWPGDPEIKLERISDIAQGADANVTLLSMGAHVGTHVDAPLHFVEDAPDVDALSLQTLMGEAYVTEIGTATMINAEVLDSLE